jgi:hypothetical protein
MNSKPSYLTTLKKYAEIYRLLGVVELELRRRIPNTLSKRRPTEPWFEFFQFDTHPNYLLKTALRRNSNQITGIEARLPFSFWVRIFRMSNFETLWRDKLVEIFPNLPKPYSLKSYRRISMKLRIVHKLRNKIAHYEPMKIHSKSSEVQDLIFLIHALGVEVQLNPSDL